MTTSPSTSRATTPVTHKLAGELSGLSRKPAGGWAADAPLVVAIPGGTYTSAYFDVPGCSLLDRAEANGIPIIALDRPGYGSSPALPPAEATIQGQARYLLGALEDCWQRHGQGTAGIVLVAHSIGGGIAASIAALHASRAPAFPLLGLALSGICLRTPPEHLPLWQSLPDTPTVEMPPPVKDQMMFGPEGSFEPAMLEASRIANAPAPKPELVDIVSTWHENAKATFGQIAVPVHYRQGEFDRLWIVNQDEVDGVRRALAKAPRSDVAMVSGTGHCMDFHHVGPALQLQQLGFALECASQSYFAPKA